MRSSGAIGQKSERTLQDERFMRLAIALGERHLGLTWPNPSVGAVVGDESGGAPVIIAQGATQPGGRPHAERMALEAAGERARGATLYVTLEPCATRSSSDHGPSCTDLILAAGIGRLVVGAPDPSPFAAGQGRDGTPQPRGGGDCHEPRGETGPPGGVGRGAGGGAAPPRGAPPGGCGRGGRGRETRGR